jgi:hypothetical protein
MKPINGAVLEVPGHAVLPVDMTGVLSNMVTVIATTNHRPGRVRDLTVQQGRSWRQIALAGTRKNNKLEIANVIKNATNLSANAPISVFMKDYADILAMLMADPTYVKDVGVDFRNELLASGAWGKTHVTGPSFGYPREYLRFTPRYDNPNGPFGLPGSRLFVDPLSDLVTDGEKAEDAELIRANRDAFPTAIADLAMTWDRANYSASLMPETKSLTQRDAKEPFFGQVSVVLNQMKRLGAVGLLYEAQSTALSLLWEDSIWNLAFELAYAQFQSLRPLLEVFKEERDTLRAKIPLHPILQLSGNLVSKITLSTRYGAKTAYTRHVAGVGARLTVPPLAAFGKSSESANGSVLAMGLAAAAVSEFARLSDIAASGAQWPREWLEAVSKGVPESSIRPLLTTPGQGGGLTFAAALHKLAVLEEYVALWPEIIRTMGWQNPPSTPEVAIDANGADFVLTDGDGYSADPVSVMAGLHPSLPISNPKVACIGIRYEPLFGIKPSSDESTSLTTKEGATAHFAFKWNVVTAEGHLSALDGPDTLTRFYITPGMTMGAEGGEPQWADETHPSTLAVKQYYDSKSIGGYVRQWATPPDAVTSKKVGETTVVATDWDIVADSADSIQAQSLMLEAYGDDQTASGSVFFYRTRWNMPIPVALTRPNCFELLDELGAYKETVRFEGHVIFNNDINVSAYTTAPIQAIIDMLPVRAPEHLSVIVEEVTAPVEPVLE